MHAQFCKCFEQERMSFLRHEGRDISDARNYARDSKLIPGTVPLDLRNLLRNSYAVIDDGNEARREPAQNHGPLYEMRNGNDPRGSTVSRKRKKAPGKG